MSYEMAPRDVEAYLNALEARIARRIERNDMAAAAATTYSLGNFFYSVMHEHRRALSLYRRAAKYDPSYRRRGYFYKDVGGILFGLDRPHLAADSYRRALALGDVPPWTRALHADALFYAGRLADAQAAFAEYERDNSTGPAEWRLKAFVLPKIQEVAGDVALRHPDEARKLVEAANVAGAPEQIDLARLSAALDEDPLCAAAWFYLGAFSGDDDLMVVGPIVAAVTILVDVAAWAACAVLAWMNGDYRGLTGDILSTAYHHTGDAIVEAFQTPPDLGIEDWGEFHALLQRVVAAEDERRLAEQGFEMRFFWGDASVSLDIRRGPPDDAR
jgi:tetratricopeptide (TPR) repeat protein